MTDPHATPTDDDERREQRLDEILAEYDEALHAGEAPSVDELVERHPELREDLAAYFQAESLLRGGEETISPGSRWLKDGRVPGEELAAVSCAVPGYRITREISRGGQGVVYEAIQESTKRPVALKVLLGGPFAGSDLRRRFQREVEMAASLRHPSIVRIYDSGIAGGHSYYSMDLIEGRPLHRFVRETSPSTQEVVSLFLEICRAVGYAHSKGIVHRDLKPTNILVDREGRPHVLDFGLAKFSTVGAGSSIERLSLTGQIIGTLEYMSPEQSSGDISSVDERSDVYSLGVLLYELLAGRLPYDLEGSLTQRLLMIQRARPRPLRAQGKSLDRGLERIVEVSLRKRREERYRDAGEMAGDLARYLEGQRIHGRRGGPVYRAARWVRKHAAAVGLVAAIIAGLGIAYREVTAPVVTVPSLQRHLPRAIVDPDGSGLSLFAVTRRGLAQRRFDIEQGWEREWRFLEDPTGLGPGDWTASLPGELLSGEPPEIALGARAESTRRVSPGVLWLYEGRSVPDVRWCAPSSGGPVALRDGAYPVASVLGPDGRTVHFFCADDEGHPGSTETRRPLLGLEARFGGDRPEVRWVDHGLPTVRDSTDDEAGKPAVAAIPGPHSTLSLRLRVTDPESGEARAEAVVGTFVTARYPDGDRLTFRMLHGTQWSWGPDLGAPGPGAEFVGGPLVYSFEYVGLSVSAFVVARLGRDKPYRLFERNLVLPDRSLNARVEGWKDYGVPLDERGQPRWGGDRRFRMTTACVYWIRNELRCNLFGYVEGDDQEPARLIEHSYLHQAWSWGVPRAVPDGGDFRVESSALARRGDDAVRVSVAGRSSTGRLWEHAYLTRTQGDIPWSWTPLSP